MHLPVLDVPYAWSQAVCGLLAWFLCRGYVIGRGRQKRGLGSEVEFGEEKQCVYAYESPESVPRDSSMDPGA